MAYVKVWHGKLLGGHSLFKVPNSFSCGVMFYCCLWFDFFFSPFSFINIFFTQRSLFLAVSS